MTGAAPPAGAAGAPRRARCERCGRPWPRGCLCGLVRPTANQVEVLVLQHPREAREAKGSVALMALSLARCRVVVGERFDDDALRGLLHGGHRSRLLYPESAAAPPVASPSIAPEGREDDAARPSQLVVLDATWRKSLRLLLEHPLLQALPRQALAPGPEAAGRGYLLLRPARHPGQLSTLEATCQALAGLERCPARYAPLLDAFEHFVARSLRARGGG